MSKYDDLGSILFNCYKNRLSQKSWIHFEKIIEKNGYIFLYKVIKLDHGKYLNKALIYNLQISIKTL
jgi:hypothetical protein